jgi:hypothetical protein
MKQMEEYLASLPKAEVVHDNTELFFCFFQPHYELFHSMTGLAYFADKHRP